MSLPLQNSTKIAVGERMCAYWIIHTSVLTQQEIELSHKEALECLL